jgi:hypothetical protein
MPELKMSRAFLARGLDYLLDPGKRHPVRQDVAAELPALIAQVQQVMRDIGVLIEKQGG